MENFQKNEKGDEQHSAAQTEEEASRGFQIKRNSDLESGREFPRGNSWRTVLSGSLSRGSSSLSIEEMESNKKVKEAGDDGGKSTEDSGHEDNNMEMEVSVPDDTLILSYAIRIPDGIMQYTSSPVSPLSSDIVCPLLSERGRADLDTGGREKQLLRQHSEANQEQLPQILEYASLLAYLAIFGIIGVLIRYALQVLFGPNVANITNDLTPLYIDLPSNMVGSFFMGWLGVVFKRDISFYSEFLAIGLSTGLLGSITTLTGWIQKVVNLTTKRHWVAGLVGLLLGMELAQISLSLGIESAKFLKEIITYIHSQIGGKWPCFIGEDQECKDVDRRT